MILSYKIEEEVEIKKFLENIKLPKMLRSELSKKTGSFIVNDQIVYNYYLLKKGDILKIIIPSSESDNICSVKEAFEIVYEDPYLLIINKKNDLACIPSQAHYNKSLANHIMAYYKEKGIAQTVHFVNRLDAPTSGLLIVAKNAYLKNIMATLAIEKKYLLLVEGIVLNNEGVIEHGIERVNDNVMLRTISKNAPLAKTSYRVLKRFSNNTLVEATLHTGKTHQIRVHFQALGHPIVGDILYGKGKIGDRLLLHSYYLSFIHPISNEKIGLINYPDWPLHHFLPS